MLHAFNSLSLIHPHPLHLSLTLSHIRKRPSQLKSLFINSLLLLQIKKNEFDKLFMHVFSHSVLFALKVMAFSLLCFTVCCCMIFHFRCFFLSFSALRETFHSFCTILLKHWEDWRTSARLCRMLSYYTHIRMAVI